MKILVILLFMLNTVVTYASDNIYFTKIPKDITKFEAVNAVSQAASMLKWTVYEFENKKLGIKLNHRDYKVLLKFSFSEREIHYSDSTTFLNRDAFDDLEGVWEVTEAPENWLKNLKRDTDKYLTKIKIDRKIRETFSHENIEIKLKTLKKLHAEKLITSSEYEIKKKEILSRY